MKEILEKKLPTVTQSVVIAGLLFCQAARLTASEPSTSGPDFHALQKRIYDATHMAIPSVVRIKSGSGVVISADGLILSQHHVIEGEKTGAKLKVFLADGTNAEAELLGTDPLYDLAALKLNGPGPYKHSPLADAVPKIGDEVIKLGYPMGSADRPIVVRLGRVLVRSEDQFISDCICNGGDSGGPFYDLEGRVVGLISVVGSSGSGWPTEKSAKIAVEGIMRRYTLPETVHAAPLLSRRLPALKSGGVVQITAADRARMQADQTSMAKAPTLSVERWSQGKQSMTGFRCGEASASVVELLGWRNRIFALGTVVDAEGLVVTVYNRAVTEASYCPDGLHCRVADGSVVEAELIGVDPGYNLALLRVKVNGLKPVSWIDSKNVPAGTLLASVGLGISPLTAGVVSVTRREMSNPVPASLNYPSAAPPELIGSSVPGRGYWIEFTEGNALDAGVRPGDLVISIRGAPIRSNQDLVACVAGHRPGERVTIRLLRESRQIDLNLRLPPDLHGRDSGQDPEDFYPPIALEGDLPLLEREYGGPVVGLDGKVIGVAVGRIAPQACVIVPADRVVARLTNLKAGKPPSVPPSTTNPDRPVGEPGKKAVTVSLDGVKAALKERGDRFRSVLVEYEVTHEARVEPGLLVAWQLEDARDLTRRHTDAFSGQKRLSDKAQIGLTMHLAPADRVAADPTAPKAVAENHLAASIKAKNSREKGSLDHLFFFGTRAMMPRRTLFDGKACYITLPNGQQLQTTHLNFGEMNYLSNLGLRPLDPTTPEDMAHQSQDHRRFPGNFDRYEKSRVRPVEELVDGVGCVVVEGNYAQDFDGKSEQIVEVLWLDPTIGYAPRKWEARTSSRLVWQRTNRDFREFAPGCWLPLQGVQVIGTPAWVPPDLRDRPAKSYNMRLLWARVNDVPDEVFKPEFVLKP
jgi:S1-C subfamily serine protease